MLQKSAVLLPQAITALKAAITPDLESAQKTAGTLRISPEYTDSVRVLRAAVRANYAAGCGHVTGERIDDVTLDLIDIVPLLDQAARRTLKVVAGQLKRACAKRHNGNH